MTRPTRIAPIVLATLLVATPGAAEDEPTPVDPDVEVLEPLLPQTESGSSAPPPWEAEDVDCAGEMGVLRDLRGRSRELDHRERDLDAREAAVQRLEARAAEQIDRLEQMRAEILRAVAAQAEKRDDRVAELAKMIAAMKAKKAAPMLATMEEPTAIRILESLGAKQAGKILASMSARDAQRLGDRYTQLPDPRDTDGPADAEEAAR